MVESSAVMHQPLPEVLEAIADEESERASPVLVDKDCDFQRLVDDLERDSHAELGPCAVERDNSADRAACDDRKDTAGILADTAACAHRRERAVDLVDSREKSRVVASQPLAFLDDAER